MTRTSQRVVAAMIAPLLIAFLMLAAVWVTFGWLLLPLIVKELLSLSTFASITGGLLLWWLGVGVILYFYMEDL